MHHVISRGNNKEYLFHSEEDFLYYINLLEHARKIYPINIYNFVLMDNHIHLLVEPKGDAHLAKVMEIVTKGYAKYFNKKNGRTGHVFEGRYKSFLVQEERYFFVCSRYIDFNPVKSGQVQEPREYKWSGYRHLAYGEGLPLEMNQHTLYEQLGSNDMERQIGYRAVVAHITEELDLLDKRTRILGDKAFKKEVKSNNMTLVGNK